MPESRQYRQGVSEPLAQAVHDQGEGSGEIARSDEDDGANEFFIGYGSHLCGIMAELKRNGNDDEIRIIGYGSNGAGAFKPFQALR